jgi:hypothetical protein
VQNLGVSSLADCEECVPGTTLVAKNAGRLQSEWQGLRI